MQHDARFSIRISRNIIDNRSFAHYVNYSSNSNISLKTEKPRTRMLNARSEDCFQIAQTSRIRLLGCTTLVFRY